MRIYFRRSVIYFVNLFSTYCWINKNPHLALYYPLKSSMVSVFLRFMGFLVMIGWFFIILLSVLMEIYNFSSYYNFIILSILNNLILSALYSHILNSIKHLEEKL
jgi:hypothetical protein